MSTHLGMARRILMDDISHVGHMTWVIMNSSSSILLPADNGPLSTGKIISSGGLSPSSFCCRLFHYYNMEFS
jgi:hypothetical protein